MKQTAILVRQHGILVPAADRDSSDLATVTGDVLEDTGSPHVV